MSSSDRTKTEDLSEADVSAKLEMLSAKMSWVVEYPKNFKPNEVCMLMTNVYFSN